MRVITAYMRVCFTRSGFTAEDYIQAKFFPYSSIPVLRDSGNGLLELSARERAEFALNYFVGTGDSLKSLHCLKNLVSVYRGHIPTHGGSDGVHFTCRDNIRFGLLKLIVYVQVS